MLEHDNGRNPDGTFKAGCVANPEGRGAKDNPWQPFGVRSRYWLSRLTRRELRELAQNEEEMDKLSSYDSMVITALVGAQTGKDKGRERERVLNRIEGPPAQTIKIGGDGGDAIKVADATTAVYGMLGELADRKQSGSGEADSVAQGGEAGADNPTG